jgi:hypothetical protein
MSLTPSEEKAREIGKVFGALIGTVIANAIFAGIIYAILAFMIGVSVSYLQVFGATLLIYYIKNFFKK